MNYVNNMGNDWRMPTWNTISYVFGFLNWSNGASEIKNYLGNFLTIFGMEVSTILRIIHHQASNVAYM